MTCGFEGCQRPKRAKGLCLYHYKLDRADSNNLITDVDAFWEFVKKEVGIK